MALGLRRNSSTQLASRWTLTATLSLQIERITAIQLDDSDPRKDKHTAKARVHCDDASKMFEELDDQNGIATCLITRC